jgi:hypothetical protein
VRDDARRRYEDAVERREQVLAEWVDEGRPTTARYGQVFATHPLLKLLHELDALCDRLGKSVGVRARGTQEAGRPSDAPDELTDLSPAAKLRAVG